MPSRTTLLVALLALPLLTFAAPPASRIKITEDPKSLRIDIDGQHFTTYRFAATDDDPKFNRPYFWPVLAADGTLLTSDQYRLGLKETADHPHHRSIWVAHGNVNGLDHWLLKDKHQRHVKFTSIKPDEFVEELTWDGKDPTSPVLTETRTVKVHAYDDGSRGLEITSLITASSGPVEFKCRPLNVSGVEAGFCSVRLAKSLANSPQATITNSTGKTGEKDCRAVPAEWCDISGTINGKPYGIAMFNDPANPGGLTPWHVRKVGFIAHIGPLNWTLDQAKSATFRHLVLIHPGDSKSADLNTKYKQFLSPSSK